MTSTKTAHKLPPVNQADNTWQAIGGRVAEEHRQLIDAACAKLNQRRAHFVVQAAIERAAEVLGIQIEWLEPEQTPAA